MDQCKLECNIIEYAVYIKAIATAGLIRRLIDYAAFVAVSLGADVERGRQIMENRKMTPRKAVESAAEDLIKSFGHLAVTEDRDEAEKGYEAAVTAFADVCAAFVCTASTPREFELVRWEVEDPQPVKVPESN